MRYLVASELVPEAIELGTNLDDNGYRDLGLSFGVGIF